MVNMCINVCKALSTVFKEDIKTPMYKILCLKLLVSHAEVGSSFKLNSLTP